MATKTTNPVKTMLAAIEAGLSAEFSRSSAIQHSGDKGESREKHLQDALAKHLPWRFGITKGAAFLRDGSQSSAMDIMIYDKINTALLLNDQNSLVQLPSINGVIEVKSTLSKAELTDAFKKMVGFKALGSMGSIRMDGKSMVVTNGHWPFGYVFAYSLGDNSLDSLFANVQDLMCEVADEHLPDAVVVLGHGIIQLAVDVGGDVLRPDGGQLAMAQVDAVERQLRSAVKTQASSVKRAFLNRSGGFTFGSFFLDLLRRLESTELQPARLEDYLVAD